MKRPNFLVILTDQQRRMDMGCYGNSVCRTPNLDRLAGEGVTFDNCYVQNVICSPSRASLLTGRYPRAHGLITNGVPLSEDEITLPQVLADNGYRTAAAGKLHLTPYGDTPENDTPESYRFWREGREFPLPYYGFQQVRLASGHGSDHTHYYRDLLAIDPELPKLFDQSTALKPPSGAPSSWKSALPEEHHSSTWVANETINFLDGFAKGDDPFFMFMGIPDPHFPYCPPAPWCDMYDPASVPMPRRRRDEVEGKPSDYQWRLERFAKAWPYHPLDMPDDHIREIIAHTYGMVSLLDKHVGRVLDHLDRLGLADDTVVVFSTDHGEHLGDHWLIYKASPYDELTHIPMIWRWPGHFSAGMRQDGFVGMFDTMPTILELAGVDPPRGVQAASLLDGLSDPKWSGRPWVLAEDDDIDPSMHLRTLHTPRYRMSCYFERGDGEMYDMEKDPDEFRNVWNDPAYARDKDELLRLMLHAVVDATDPKPKPVASA